MAVVQKQGEEGTCPWLLCFPCRSSLPGAGPLPGSVLLSPVSSQSHVQLRAQLRQEQHAFTPAKLTCHKRHCTGWQGNLGVPACWSPETPPLLNRLPPEIGAEAASPVP